MATYVFDAVQLTASSDVHGINVPTGYRRKYTKFTVFNDTGAPVTLEIFLCKSGSVASSATQVIGRVLENQETDALPELIGATLLAGGNLRASGLDLAFSYVAEDTVIA